MSKWQAGEFSDDEEKSFEIKNLSFQKESGEFSDDDDKQSIEIKSSSVPKELDQDLINWLSKNIFIKNNRLRCISLVSASILGTTGVLYNILLTKSLMERIGINSPGDTILGFISTLPIMAFSVITNYKIIFSSISFSSSYERKIIKQDLILYFSNFIKFVLASILGGSATIGLTYINHKAVKDFNNDLSTPSDVFAATSLFLTFYFSANSSIEYVSNLVYMKLFHVENQEYKRKTLMIESFDSVKNNIYLSKQEDLLISYKDLIDHDLFNLDHYIIFKSKSDNFIKNVNQSGKSIVILSSIIALIAALSSYTWFSTTSNAIEYLGGNKNWQNALGYCTVLCTIAMLTKSSYESSIVIFQGFLSLFNSEWRKDNLSLKNSFFQILIFILAFISMASRIEVTILEVETSTLLKTLLCISVAIGITGKDYWGLNKLISSIPHDKLKRIKDQIIEPLDKICEKVPLMTKFHSKAFFESCGNKFISTEKYHSFDHELEEKEDVSCFNRFKICLAKIFSWRSSIATPRSSQINPTSASVVDSHRVLLETDFPEIIKDQKDNKSHRLESHSEINRQDLILSKSYSTFEANSNKAGRPEILRSSSEIKREHRSSARRPLSPRSSSLQNKILFNPDGSGLPRSASELMQISKKDERKKNIHSSPIPFAQNQHTLLAGNSRIQQGQQREEQHKENSSWKCAIL